MSSTFTFEQMEALFDKTLSQFKEAVDANTAKLTSVESKLEAHDA